MSRHPYIVVPQRRGLPGRPSLRLHSRARLVEEGALPSSAPTFNYPVAIGHSMVEVLACPTRKRPNLHEPILSDKVQRAIDEVTEWSHKVWFDQDGNAFISFADEQDATMFRLALDGDVS